jgi:tRNA pseudouridine55 synthase
MSKRKPVRGSRPAVDLRRTVEGILVIDKPTGISSYGVIREIKKRLLPKKIGHTGTLDPLASGVLPVAMNGATKVIPFLDERIKRYEARLRLGIVTDSDDSTGRVLRESALDASSLTEDRIRHALKGFLGRIMQVPPMHSAVKHHGIPLYKLARRGIQVERRVREVEIFGLEVTGIDLPVMDMTVTCSKGTYIRSLARQIGEALGVGAHVCHLRRTGSGFFSLEQSVTLPEFERLVERGEIERRIITIREALGSMAEIEINEDLGGRIKTGRQVLLEDLKGLAIPRLEERERVKILHRGEMVAIAEAQVAHRDLDKPILKTPAFALLRVFA